MTFTFMLVISVAGIGIRYLNCFWNNSLAHKNSLITVKNYANYYHSNNKSLNGIFLSKESFRIKKSFTNQNQPLIYVTTLQNVSNAHPANKNRLDKFIQAWSSTCGHTPLVKVCPGVVDERRGYGLTSSYIACFQRAIADGQPNPMFFEDDARLSNTVLCKKNS